MLGIDKIKEALAEGKYAFPGGYPLYFMAKDGQPLSFEAVKENIDLVNQGDPEWDIVAQGINWEDNDLRCSHTEKLIEAAYSDD